MNPSPHSPTLDHDAIRVMLAHACNPHIQSRYAGELWPRIELRVVRYAVPADSPTPSGFRWVTWSSDKRTAVLVDDLVVSCEVQRKDGKLEFICFAHYFDGADRRRLGSTFVAAAHRTLTKLDKATADTHRDGSVSDFIVYAHKVMAALGIKDGYMYAYKPELEHYRGDLSVEDSFVPLPHTRAQMQHLSAMADRLCP